jgi:glucosamine--fructose-6-phosphate aminotransferase (isomerizing)
MLEEIHEQPEAVRRTLAAERARLAGVAEEIRRRDPALVLIAARGTSDNAAIYAQYLWAIRNGLPVALAAPSVTTLYGATPRLRDTVVLGISQSGESTDIVEVVRAARAQGAYTLAVTAAASSSLAAAADETALCHVGVERAVAATKTYTAQLAVLSLLSALLAGDDELLAALDAVPEAMSAVLQSGDLIAERAERYRQIGACAVLGRGLNYCTAMEVALKIKETSYVVADPYSGADFQHGPIAIVEPGLAGEAVSPLVYTVAGQLFAHALCTARGLDPDHPRGLKKVTLTL